MAYNEKDGMYYGYIYKIVNDVNDKIYIGQTTTNAKLRWQQHMHEAKSARFEEMILYKAMRKHGLDNFILLIVEELSSDTKDDLISLLNDKEIYYISLYNTLMPTGYNMTVGGGSNSERIKVAIDAYFANGLLDARYESINAASRSATGDANGCTGIIKCCNGEQQYAYGRIWRYAGDSFDKYPLTYTQDEIDNYKQRIRVCQYSLDGKLIKIYNSISEAAITLGYAWNRTSDISNCCKGLCDVAFGYVWRFEGDSFYKYCKKVNQYKNGKFIQTFNFLGEAEVYLDKNIVTLLICVAIKNVIRLMVFSGIMPTIQSNQIKLKY